MRVLLAAVAFNKGIMIHFNIGFTSIYIGLRHGFGFDIEYNDEIQHTFLVDDKEELLSYAGAIVKLPFMQIYIGDYYSNQ